MTSYREKVHPPISLLIALLLILPATFLVFLPIDTTAGIVIAIALYVAVTVVIVGIAPTISVSEEGLRVGDARLPASAVGRIDVHRGSEARAQRGVELDARAHLAIRGGVDGVVLVEVSDDDPTPYWLVSSRRPDELAAALEAIRQRTPDR